MCISSAKVYWNEMSLLNAAYVQHIMMYMYMHT